LRIPIPDGADRFDFNVAPHYHVKCRICNQVSDVDMPYQAELYDQIADTKGFSHGISPDSIYWCVSRVSKKMKRSMKKHERIKRKIATEANFNGSV